jgi:hypothetical protein
MKRFGQLREEISGVAWQKNLYDLIWQPNDQKMGYIPLSKQMLRRLGITGETQREEWAIHVTDYKGLVNVLKMQGSAKALSTMTKVTSVDMALAYFGADEGSQGGIQTEGGVVIQLSGDVVAAGAQDLMSAPDSQGRRWMDSTGVLGALIGASDEIRTMENMMSELFTRKANMITREVGTFYGGIMGLRWPEDRIDYAVGEDSDIEIPTPPENSSGREAMRWMHWLGSGHSSRYIKLAGTGKTKNDKVLLKYIRKFVGTMIGRTFDLIEKHLSQSHYTEFLKELITGEKGWTTWNEIVLNRIKIKEVWIRDSATFNVTALEELVSKKGIKVQVYSDGDWDQELEWIFQDMEV